MLLERPESAVDLWADDALRNPYPLYRELRETSGAVYLRHDNLFALSRFIDVRDALRNWKVFSSADGVGVDEEQNRLQSGANMLSMDGPEHVAVRKVLGRPLTSLAVTKLRDTIAAEAETVVERVVELGTFDGVRHLAWHLPLAVVRNLVGLPEEGRARMLQWGHAGFNALGPRNERFLAGRQLRLEGLEYFRTHALPEKLLPGSWGAQLYEASERGEIPFERCALEMIGYVGPSLDTTINATSSALWLFSEHPDQWQILREQPELVANAVDEVLRLESPVQFFTRHLLADVTIDDVFMPAGSRVLVMYGSANRDERRWVDPETFDVRRDAGEQLSFGHGSHVCLGMPLARLEMEMLFKALLKRVKRFEAAADAKRALNNTLRGFERLPLRVVP